MSRAREAKKSAAPARGTGTTILRRVPYRIYTRLRDEPANDHLRMTYYDGTLELMSPEFVHEVPGRRLGAFVTILTGELGLPCTPSGSTTFRRRGEGIYKGKGKEPDESFYLANEHRVLDKETIDLDVGDPPPDLWIEVDNRASLRGRLPVYAELGVPEVWRYQARRRTVWFGRLTEGGDYEPIERSVSLPMLTRALVLEALALGEGQSGAVWYRRLKEWIRDRLGPLPGGAGG